MSKLETLKSWVQESNRIVFFGGAGVSTESGIPDFRSRDGLYSQNFDYPPEQILSHSFFRRDPACFYRFYRQKMLPVGCLPNITHQKLAQWEQQGKLMGIITQNIDGLHQLAGSRCVCELHGSTLRNYCQWCGKAYDVEFIRSSTGVPRCPCGGIVKPDVVLYEEMLDQQTVERSLGLLSQADLLIVAGTSLTVYPAAGMVEHYQGNRMVLINRDETPFDDHANLVFHQSLGEIFAQLP